MMLLTLNLSLSWFAKARILKERWGALLSYGAAHVDRVFAGIPQERRIALKVVA
jgi:hypothetical protein